MFVIEVRPKHTWRGLRFLGEGVPQNARITTRHTATSHWYQRETAQWLIDSEPALWSAGRPVTVPRPQWRIVACGCRPESLR